MAFERPINTRHSMVCASSFSYVLARIPTESQQRTYSWYFVIYLSQRVSNGCNGESSTAGTAAADGSAPIPLLFVDVQRDV